MQWICHLLMTSRWSSFFCKQAAWVTSCLVGRIEPRRSLAPGWTEWPILVLPPAHTASGLPGTGWIPPCPLERFLIPPASTADWSGCTAVYGGCSTWLSQCKGIFKWEHIALTFYRLADRDNCELCLNTLKPEWEMQGSLMRPFWLESVLLQTGVAVKTQVACIKAWCVEGDSELCC